MLEADYLTIPKMLRCTQLVTTNFIKLVEETSLAMIMVERLAFEY